MIDKNNHVQADLDDLKAWASAMASHYRITVDAIDTITAVDEYRRCMRLADESYVRWMRFERGR